MCIRDRVGTIKFRTNGDGDIFDVIRNHSYLFKIKLSTIEIDAELQYQVMDWTEVDNCLLYTSLHFAETTSY